MSLCWAPEDDAQRVKVGDLGDLGPETSKHVVGAKHIARDLCNWKTSATVWLQKLIAPWHIPRETLSTVPGFERPSFDLLSWKALYASVRPEKTGFFVKKATGDSVLDVIVAAVVVW